MRVLFVPMAPTPIISGRVPADRYATPLSHVITLLALWRLLPASFESAFLLSAPEQHHRRVKNMRVLPIDHRGLLQTELSAYRQFKPHVVVDDTSLTTGFATIEAGIPRVTLARTGVFRDYAAKDARHRHTLEVGPGGTGDSGISLPKALSDIFRASLSIVPGIPAIELLPVSCRMDPTYVFAGPLLVSPSDPTADGFAPLGPSGEVIDAFCDSQRRQQRPIVFVTTGTNWRPEAARVCVKRLLDVNLAVLSTCVVDDLESAQRARYLGSYFMPMHKVCADADVVVHSCGSGTYHYPIIHGVPTVTLGSACFDRDDVAVRLQELGVSMHVPDCSERSVSVARVVAAVQKSIGRRQALEFRQCVQPLQSAMEWASKRFDFPDALRKLADRSSAR
jgi:UDP:flavonoid glycosyltransferase YjiC (YdhE family)